MTLALISVAGFVLRAGWTFTAPDLLQQKFVRIAPHIIDTLLLLSGFWLAFQLAEGSSISWLVAKLVALVGYIGFGVLTLRGTGNARMVGIVGALVCVGYIFMVAFTRQALPYS